MFVSGRKLSKWECFLTLAPIFYNGTSKCGLSETDVRQQGEAEFDEYKKRSESTRSVKRNHCGATNRRIQNALENVTFAIPDTTGMVKENRFDINFDLIDIESGMIVKLPWVNLTSPKAGKQQNWKKLRLCSIQNPSALENVLRTGAMAMLCTTETQIEEIWKKEKPEAQAEAKGNIEKQHPKKSIQCNNAVVWLQIHRRNHFSAAINNIPKPCWSFRAGVLLNRSFSFLFFFSRGLRRPL